MLARRDVRGAYTPSRPAVNQRAPLLQSLNPLSTDATLAGQIPVSFAKWRNWAGATIRDRELLDIPHPLPALLQTGTRCRVIRCVMLGRYVKMPVSPTHFLPAKTATVQERRNPAPGLVPCLAVVLAVLLLRLAKGQGPAGSPAAVPESEVGHAS